MIVWTSMAAMTALRNRISPAGGFDGSNRISMIVGLPTGASVRLGSFATTSAWLTGTPWTMSARPAWSSATRVAASGTNR